jgi:multimeric flavodoxin WrbA
MKITIISGSTRLGSASINVSKYLQSQLNVITDTIDINLFDLARTNLPMWDEETDLSLLEQETTQLHEADGFVFVIPEWHGMVPPAVKNLFFLFGSVFRHKPAYLVTTSAGSGGRYPISEMRMSTYKNSFINYIPVNTVIDRVNATISEHGEYIAEKQFVANRCDEGLRILVEYTKAFTLIRNSEIVLEKRFPNGV